MCGEDESPGRLSSLGLPALVGGGIVLLHFLPREVLDVLTLWALVSFPIGVLIGHCVLSEE